MSDVPAAVHFFDVDQKQLPDNLRAHRSLHESLVRQIDAGDRLTDFQCDFILGCVRHALAQKLRLPRQYAAIALRRLEDRASEGQSQGDDRLLHILQSSNGVRMLAQSMMQTMEQQLVSKQPTHEVEDEPEKRPPLPDPARLTKAMKDAIAQQQMERVVELADQICESFPSYPSMLFIAGLGYLARAGSIRKREDLALRLHYINRAIDALTSCRGVAAQNASFRNLLGPCSAKLKVAMQAREKTAEAIHGGKDNE